MATTASEPTESRNVEKPRRDFRQEVTDRIVRLLERGVVPWEPRHPGTEIPFNPTNNREFRGGNAIHLMATALEQGYQDPRWMTYQQASNAGWQVRQGEKGTQIEYWDVRSAAEKTQADGRTDGSAADPAKPRLVQRLYTVFNGEQIDRIPLYVSKGSTTFESVGEQILKNSGVHIVHDQADRSFYNRADDSIHMPSKARLGTDAAYYTAALRELTHWSGHPSRLDRSTLTSSYRFGDVTYAREELRTELASAFLHAPRVIALDFDQEAAYAASWVAALRGDKNELFRAAHDASMAADFIVALERDKSIGEERLAIGIDLASETSASSPVAVLEKMTGDLEHDRERIAEQGSNAILAIANEGPAPVRESSEYAARHEPGSGTVNIEAKQMGIDRRSTVDAPDWGSLSGAKRIVAETIGKSAQVLEAVTGSGNYRGTIVGETEQHVIQRQSAKTGIVHPKHLLDHIPEIGANVRIDYSLGHGSVRDVSERARDKDRGR